jgi:hypothetical protein
LDKKSYLRKNDIVALLKMKIKNNLIGFWGEEVTEEPRTTLAYHAIMLVQEDNASSCFKVCHCNLYLDSTNPNGDKNQL